MLLIRLSGVSMAFDQYYFLFVQDMLLQLLNLQFGCRMDIRWALINLLLPKRWETNQTWRQNWSSSSISTALFYSHSKHSANLILKLLKTTKVYHTTHKRETSTQPSPLGHQLISQRWGDHEEPTLVLYLWTIEFLFKYSIYINLSVHFTACRPHCMYICFQRWGHVLYKFCTSILAVYSFMFFFSLSHF